MIIKSIDSSTSFKKVGKTHINSQTLNISWRRGLGFSNLKNPNGKFHIGFSKFIEKNWRCTI